MIDEPHARVATAISMKTAMGRPPQACPFSRTRNLLSQRDMGVELEKRRFPVGHRGDMALVVRDKAEDIGRNSARSLQKAVEVEDQSIDGAQNGKTRMRVGVLMMSL